VKENVSLAARVFAASESNVNLLNEKVVDKRMEIKDSAL